MDEKQWMTEQRQALHMTQVLSKLGYPRTKGGRRKLRLFACGCSRLAWAHVTEERLWRAVEVAEKFADGLADQAELIDAHSQKPGIGDFHQFKCIADWQRNSAACMAVYSCHPKPLDAAFQMTGHEFSPLADWNGVGKNGEWVVCDLLRCVFGNPFQKPAFNKKWRTETVTALATGIYEERAFDRLPILADALEEAGCDDPAMLAHLRGDGPHCRGCWVVDLALGK